MGNFLNFQKHHFGCYQLIKHCNALNNALHFSYSLIFFFFIHVTLLDVNV